MSEETKREEQPKNDGQEAPLLVRGGLDQEEIELLRTRIASLGKCCEGGSEGWTG